MTAKEFQTFWRSSYPDAVPIGHHFKHSYSHRWFRIHSLPDSRRYPSDQEDWEILLTRQNTILTDFFADGSVIAIVTGDFHYEGYTELHPINNVESIESFVFTRLEAIDLHLYDEENYEKGTTYIPMFTEQIWCPHRFDELLRDIAEGNLAAFFVSISNNCIVAPYDGGMDIIMKDSLTRDLCKEQYREWLSFREDGL
ncbi:hypothetical protein L3C95_18225 [Chitinophaga filiformis]|uniref:DUF3885 domain-containing protein n=1 Tax=Chitinophaga filiformis TaxID=104663 RepID=UPI001F265D14|nr:hypothetical protein [Chitinophaga filiformis]MCF6404842.1 hypothetical protein [Chitinophaga filiformis]